LLHIINETDFRTRLCVYIIPQCNGFYCAVFTLRLCSNDIEATHNCKGNSPTCVPYSITVSVVVIFHTV